MKVPEDVATQIEDYAKRTGSPLQDVVNNFMRLGTRAFGLDYRYKQYDKIDPDDLSTLDQFPSSIKRISTVTEYLTHVRDLHEDRENPGADPLRFYYRGQPGPYPLLPKLSRPSTAAALVAAHKKALGRSKSDLNDAQSEMIFRLVRYAEQYRTAASSMQDVNDYLSWLCIAQHHGLPTFLLDWAVNPLAALFFACENVGPSDALMDGIVWYMELKKHDERDAGGILHLEKMPFHLEIGNQKDLFAINEICRTAVIGEDHPKIIVPRMLTRRIEVQAGRFLAISARTRANRFPVEDRSIAWKHIRPLVVVENKDGILAELSMLRIHHGSIYADIDSYAKFLSLGNL